mmetsp:Transcript_18383/g.28385  ORF Transcript_18383/g.28385 Transcript_18383/m.28385 type:complete len:465 (-) Transcript_18383:406-1800(-)
MTSCFDCGYVQSNSARPSVFEETIEMLTGALLIYVFADLREMARGGELSTPISDFEPPILIDNVVKSISNNKEALEKRSFDHESLKERLHALNDASQNWKYQTSFPGSLFDNSKKTVLAHFHDENSSQEMVHGIVVNSKRKRITVIFRGSVTKQDFITDAKCHQKKVENPAFHLAPEKTTETVNLHTGFYDYLFQKNKSGVSRFEGISNDVKQLLEQNPGFRVYCTGHSLGGALSTMCGFYLAADDALVKHGAVTVVSIASPLVGNMKFRTAFQALERLNRLQHLRVCNKEDTVTVMPFAAPKVTALSPALAAVAGAGNLYKHCGMRLRLKSVLRGDYAQPYNICYTKDHGDDDAYSEEVKRALASGKTLMGSFLHVVKRDFDKIKEFHKCEEYEARLQTCKKYLVNVTLDDLYNNKSIVGSVLDDDYQPEIALNVVQKASKLVKTRRSKKGNKKVSSLDQQAS